MNKSKAELDALAVKFKWHVRPISEAEVSANGTMSSDELAWHALHNAKNLDRAVNPPPPPAPKETTIQDVEKEFAKFAAISEAEFQEWLKINGGQANRVTYDEFQKEKQQRITAVKKKADEAAEDERLVKLTRAFYSSHPDVHKGDDNTHALSRWFSDHLTVPVTEKSLELAFYELSREGKIAFHRPYRLHEIQSVLNGVAVFADQMTSEQFQFALNHDPHFRAKVDKREKKLDSAPS